MAKSCKRESTCIISGWGNSKQVPTEVYEFFSRIVDKVPTRGAAGPPFGFHITPGCEGQLLILVIGVSNQFQKQGQHQLQRSFFNFGHVIALAMNIAQWLRQ
jgi:hypothetical protein